MDPTLNPPLPGSVEYAAAAKQMLADRIDRTKDSMRAGADLLSVIYGCAYDDREGMCFDMLGDRYDLMNLIAIAILQLATREYEERQKSERFLPVGNQMSFKAVAAGITRQILDAVKGASVDKKIEKPQIITPDDHGGS